MAVDGGKPERICDGDQAEWSPDGKRIALRKKEQIVVRDLASGSEKSISPKDWPHCSGPAWSPDGKTIAFACRWDEGNATQRPTFNSLFLVSADGGEPVKVYDKKGACEPHWSPDGKRLVYETETNICTIDPDGKKNRPVTFFGGVQRYGRFSPDGKSIVYCQGESEQGPWELYIDSRPRRHAGQTHRRRLRHDSPIGNKQLWDGLPDPSHRTRRIRKSVPQRCTREDRNSHAQHLGRTGSVVDGSGCGRRVPRPPTTSPARPAPICSIPARRPASRSAPSRLPPSRAGKSCRKTTLTHKFQGDVVLLNDRLTIVLRAKGAGAEVYCQTPAGAKQRAILAPLGLGGSPPASLSGVQIIENNHGRRDGRCALSRRPSGGKCSLKYRLTAGQITRRDSARRRAPQSCAVRPRAATWSCPTSSATTWSSAPPLVAGAACPADRELSAQSARRRQCDG